MRKGAPIINGLFILLFTYTGLSKLMALGHFRFVLGTAPFIGHYSRWLAPVIPVAELAVAGLMFIPATARKGLVAGVALLILFTGYLVFMILTGDSLPCSCGGVIQQMSWKQHVVFNICFIAAGITGLNIQNRKVIETSAGKKAEINVGSG